MFIDASFIAFLGFIALLIKFRASVLRKLLHFDIFLDIAVTFLLMALFAGTFSGMMTALAAGVMFSWALILMKKLYGYEKLERHTCESCKHTHTRWVEVPPTWRRKKSTNHTEGVSQ